MPASRTSCASCASIPSMPPSPPPPPPPPCHVGLGLRELLSTASSTSSSSSSSTSLAGVSHRCGGSERSRRGGECATAARAAAALMPPPRPSPSTAADRPVGTRAAALMRVLTREGPIAGRGGGATKACASRVVAVSRSRGCAQRQPCKKLSAASSTAAPPSVAAEGEAASRARTLSDAVGAAAANPLSSALGSGPRQRWMAATCAASVDWQKSASPVTSSKPMQPSAHTSTAGP